MSERLTIHIPDRQLRWLRVAGVSWLLLIAGARHACCADSAITGAGTESAETATDSLLAPPERIDVEPVARDAEIGARLARIFEATGWYTAPVVDVREGVAFLSGETSDTQYQKWAGDLARNTEGVVGVVNKIDVQTGSPWNFNRVQQELSVLLRSLVAASPFVMLGVLVLLLAWVLARVVCIVLRHVLQRRIASNLLREVAARSVGLLVFLLGLYFVLRVSGLTRLAVTVIGGTGIVGLVLGIAFRDITENFLASLFLSLQQPFRTGDLIEVANITGYVQRLSSRTTVLMTLNGSQVQVPNATVFKSTIRNFTSSSNRREDFVIGIGYDDLIPRAQDVALRVLGHHPAVLKDPEPWVLVDALGTSTVNLRVYFWLDGTRHSWLKVRSSVIRLTKRALQDAGVSLPDEAREIIFPQGLSLGRMDGDARRPNPQTATTEAVTTEAEAGLKTEAHELHQQAERAWTPDGGENLL